MFESGLRPIPAEILDHNTYFGVGKLACWLRLIGGLANWLAGPVIGLLAGWPGLTGGLAAELALTGWPRRHLLPRDRPSLSQTNQARSAPTRDECKSGVKENSVRSNKWPRQTRPGHVLSFTGSA